MHLIADDPSHGILERELVVDGIPVVLWSPASGAPDAPLVLMGHPGGLHKRARGLVARAEHLVAAGGFHAAAIDVQGHGDRPRSDDDQARVAAMFRAREAGEPIAPIVDEYNGSLAERTVPEWRAVLDALQALPEVGTGPVGYSGMTLATAIGLPLIAVEPRIRAAALGGVYAFPSLLDAARRVTIPVRLLLAWDDAELDRESTFALFEALGSTEKSLHANPGGHHEVPWHETEDSVRFFARHLLASRSRR
jgi:cephalosporin-C deacetylase-like acetyl esterase